MIRRASRRLISVLLQKVLRARARPLPAFLAKQVILVLAPHPDDELLGCGRLIAAHIANGGFVHIVWLTDGEASHPTIAPDEMRRQRRSEADAAAEKFGVPLAHRHRLGAPDGRLDRLTAVERESLITAMAGIIVSTRPAAVFVTSALDGSTEHAAAETLLCEATDHLDALVRPALFAYLVWAHWNIRALAAIVRRGDQVCWHADSVHNQIRADAIAMHTSQTQPIHPGEAPLLTPHFLACFPADGEFYLPI